MRAPLVLLNCCSWFRSATRALATCFPLSSCCLSPNHRPYPHTPIPMLLLGPWKLQDATFPHPLEAQTVPGSVSGLRSPLKLLRRVWAGLPRLHPGSTALLLDAPYLDPPEFRKGFHQVAPAPSQVALSLRTPCSHLPLPHP